MANPERGIIEFQSGDQTYKLKIDMNTICELEALLKKGMGQIVKSLGPEDFHFMSLRALFFVGMRPFHDVTIEQVGSILTYMDEDAISIAEDAVKAAFPKAKDSPKKPVARTKAKA